ncbi:DUF3006 domain-containing protein [Haloarcula sp. JP-L23]|uniref:DUF3006 domain-containing protein n=1 Tax=Haloarcula sp. JP-L23 TaxID=2716717 RepID=UPI00140EC2F2|nr:DUF3006 domain-containing protein [Haloarcula sp. JP-L23]
MTGLDTLADGQYTAVVDSIEDSLVTVFFEHDGEEIGDAVLEASTIPEEGRHADAILTVTIEGGEVVDWEYDPDTTEARQEAAQDRFDRLSSRPPSDEES